jgi:hypothetical protein
VDAIKATRQGNLNGCYKYFGLLNLCLCTSSDSYTICLLSSFELMPEFRSITFTSKQ